MFMKVQVSSIWKAVGFEPTAKKTKYTTLITRPLRIW